MSLLGRLGRSLRRFGATARPVAGAVALPAGVGAERFPYRGDLAGCRVVSENTLAALSGESVEALHRLELFDGEGKPLQVLEERSRRPFVGLEPVEAGPALGSVRISLEVDPDRLGPEAAALLRQLPSPGRACLQVRPEPTGPWQGVRAERQGLELRLRADRGVGLLLFNPAAVPVVVTIAIEPPATSPPALPPSLELPAGAVRPLPLPPGSGRLLLRVAPLRQGQPRPQGLLEPPEPGGTWRVWEL